MVSSVAQLHPVDTAFPVRNIRFGSKHPGELEREKGV